MKLHYHTSYPAIDDLRERARRRIPRFAFEYLDGCCNEDVNLRKNTDDLRQVELKPLYLTHYQPSSLKTELFGHEYDAPFGVAPIGRTHEPRERGALIATHTRAIEQHASEP